MLETQIISRDPKPDGFVILGFLPSRAVGNKCLSLINYSQMEQDIPGNIPPSSPLSSFLTHNGEGVCLVWLGSSLTLFGIC